MAEIEKKKSIDPASIEMIAKAARPGNTWSFISLSGGGPALKHGLHEHAAQGIGH